MRGIADGGRFRAANQHEQTTVMTSSTISQPRNVAGGVSITCCPSARASRTTVLATAIAMRARCRFHVPAGTVRDDQAKEASPPRSAIAPHGNVPHGQQIFEMEVQSDAEHQQYHTDLRQLRCQLRVGDKSRRYFPITKPASRYPTIGEIAAACVICRESTPP